MFLGAGGYTSASGVTRTFDGQRKGITDEGRRRRSNGWV